jgi:methylenetetrahydrofolate dehydrogenase (NADP+)/methenyltetrahydrofolate cyclohydrolase
MIVDGRAIAEEIKKDLRQRAKQAGRELSLVAFVTKEDLATRKFIEIKKRFAEEIGVAVEGKYMPRAATAELVSEIRLAAKSFDGIIVQFPLAPGIDADLVRNAIPASHDIDVVSGEAAEKFARGKSLILPPVVGAIKEVAEQYNVIFASKNIVVVGEGLLVGKPAAIWARLQKAEVKTLNEKSCDISYDTRKADILILGAGVPHLIKPEMIKRGVVVFDAGTSEASGKLVGDADPLCADKASLFTPVPGGIGPITVAMVFKNLFTLKSLRN